MGIPQHPQWLRLRAFTTVGWGSIPDQGTKIPQTAQHGKKRWGGRGEDRKDGWFSFNILYIPVWFANVFCFLTQKKILSGLKGY